MLAKILVISDVHYPTTDVQEILNVISREAPDKLIVLGDIGHGPENAKEFIRILQTSACKDQVYISGDGDASVPALKSFSLSLKGREFLFIHGHQFNVVSESFTKKMAGFLKKINRNLPVLAYATYSRIRSRNRSTYIILGHSHALIYFPRLRVASSGCFTKEENVYNDRGCVSIAAVNENDVELRVNRLNGENKIYEI